MGRNVKKNIVEYSREISDSYYKTNKNVIVVVLMNEGQRKFRKC